MLYQAVNFPQAPDTDVLYKKCGSVRVGGSDLGGLGFGEKMEVVFGMVVKGVGVRGGYYAGWYEGVYALGQCQSDLGESECVNCLRNASLVAKGECSDLGSVSTEVYLERCWLTYSYYPGGADNSNRGSHSDNISHFLDIKETHDTDSFKQGNLGRKTFKIIISKNASTRRTINGMVPALINMTQRQQQQIDL